VSRAALRYAPWVFFPILPSVVFSILPSVVFSILPSVVPPILSSTLAAAVIVSALTAAPAHATDLDSAAVGKITILNRKAVEAYEHLEFETAVRILNEALELSERSGLTAHPVRARTYVTLGIVTLAGLKQRPLALTYFRKGLKIQPEIRLSPGLANPEIQAAFEEAIAELASGASDELPPEKALVHAPVHSAPGMQPVPITASPDKDLGARTLVLRYRAAMSTAFTDVEMEKQPDGTFAAAIPAEATAGPQVVYFIEARRADGGVLMTRGSAADPIVVVLAPAEVTQAARPTAARAQPPHRVFFAVLGGTGFGVTSGTGEETRNSVSSSGVAWARAVHLAPEIGFFITPRFMLGVQARLQVVTGATEYHPPNPQPGECGDGVCSPFTGAFAGLLKATWLLSAPDAAFAPYLSLSAGAGTIRHVSKVSSPNTCGSSQDQACMDTVAGGPALFGPGIGFRYQLGSNVGIVGELGALVGVPNFTANADVNIGVSFQL
jgi:hypothetical protein